MASGSSCLLHLRRLRRAPHSANSGYERLCAPRSHSCCLAVRSTMKRDNDEWGTMPELVPGDQGEDEQLDMWGTWPGLAPGDQGFMNCLKPYSEPSRTAAAGSLRSERGGARTRAEDAARPYRPADARVAICCICDREVPESQLTVRPSGSPVHRCDLCQAISMVQSVVSGSRLSEDKEFEAVAKLSEIYHSLYNSAKQEQGE